MNETENDGSSDTIEAVVQIMKANFCIHFHLHIHIAIPISENVFLVCYFGASFQEMSSPCENVINVRVWAKQKFRD